MQFLECKDFECNVFLKALRGEEGTFGNYKIIINDWFMRQRAFIEI